METFDELKKEIANIKETLQKLQEEGWTPPQESSETTDK
jgi:hypothetical protein